MVSNHPQCLGFSRSYHVHKGAQLAWSRSLLEQRIGLQAKKCWHLLFPQTFCPLMSKEKSKGLASARLVSDHGEDLGGAGRGTCTLPRWKGNPRLCCLGCLPYSSQYALPRDFGFIQYSADVPSPRFCTL